MPVPPKRLSKGRTRSRRAHHALTAPTLTTCPQCKQPTRPHTACPSCGFYKGRDVLGMKTKVEKQMRKRAKLALPEAPAEEKKESKTEKKEAKSKAEKTDKKSAKK